MSYLNPLESDQCQNLKTTGRLANRRSPVGFGVTLVGVITLIALPARAAIINVPADQPTIQAGINAANPGDEVVVAPGTYASINFSGKAITVRSTDPTNPAVVEATIVSGGNNPGVSCISGEGPNSVLSGFKIWNGGANYGGGMRNINSSPTVTYCSFIENIGVLGGGGMYNSGGSPTVTHCTFTNNSVYGGTLGGDGGGMYNVNSNPTVTDCVFSENTVEATNSKARGGGMSNVNSSPTVAQCTFTANVALHDFLVLGVGGGMYNSGSSNPTVTDCSFLGNRAYAGGGIANENNTVFVTISDCTIRNNFAFTSPDYDPRGGGVWIGLGGKIELRNCTVSQNVACNTLGCTSHRGSAVYVESNSCTFDGDVILGGEGRAFDSTFCGGETVVVGNLLPINCYVRQPDCPSTVDTDGDGVVDSDDVCPNTSPGTPVDSTGRPLRDCNEDCSYDAGDIQCLVDEMLSP